MNLHVTSDNYGLFPKVIASRIKKTSSSLENKIVNLGENSTIQDEIITYIPNTTESINNYLISFDNIQKVIFHPYKYSCLEFLQIILKTFPKAKIYWALWSFELYNLPHLLFKQHKPFAASYVNSKKTLPERIKNLKIIGNLILRFCYFTGIKKNYTRETIDSFKHIDFFCSFLPSDFTFFQKISLNTETQYVPFAYLSLETIMPDLNSYRSTGDKIMIGHSSDPDGNHYEIIQLLGELNPKFPIFLPLAYGDENYGRLIEREARKRFSAVEVQKEKLDSLSYYKKLTEVACCIINVRVQQGLGNIIALVWMGAKVFLDEESSTYKDFHNWGIHIFSIQKDLNLRELSTKLSESEIENNKSIMFKICNENTVKQYWDKILAS